MRAALTLTSPASLLVLHVRGPICQLRPTMALWTEVNPRPPHAHLETGYGGEVETAWLEDWVFREVRDSESARSLNWTKTSAHLGGHAPACEKDVQGRGGMGQALCSYIPHMNTSVHHAHNPTANPMSTSVHTGTLGAHQDDPVVF